MAPQDNEQQAPLEPTTPPATDATPTPVFPSQEEDTQTPQGIDTIEAEGSDETVSSSSLNDAPTVAAATPPAAEPSFDQPASAPSSMTDAAPVSTLTESSFGTTATEDTTTPVAAAPVSQFGATAPQAPAAPVAPVTQPVSSDAPKKGTNKTLIIILVVVVVAALAVGGYFVWQSMNTNPAGTEMTNGSVTQPTGGDAPGGDGEQVQTTNTAPVPTN